MNRSEHLDVPLVGLALLLAVWAVRAPRRSTWIAAGTAFAGAALTRSIALYAYPALAAIVWIREPGARRGIVSALVLFAAVTGSYIAAASRGEGRLAIAGFATAADRTAAFVLGTWIAVHLILIALSSTNAGPRYRYRAPLDPALFALAAAALRRV